MKTARQAQREARQLFRLCLVNGSLDEARARRVVQRMLDRARPGGLSVLSRFGRLVRLDRLEHSAEVESAEPLTADLRASIHASLTRLYGQGMTTSFAEDPTLIAGMRIKVGSDVYDGSVKGGLAALESRF
jgi:F-type H+-transporting ATPase subunit delta